jgi:hypothetical protein
MEQAKEAIRAADRAEAEAWSIRMEGYGGPAQRSPTIGQCLNGGLGWLDMMQSLQDTCKLAAGRNPQATRYAES